MRVYTRVRMAIFNGLIFAPFESNTLEWALVPKSSRQLLLPLRLLHPLFVSSSRVRLAQRNPSLVHA